MYLVKDNNFMFNAQFLEDGPVRSAAGSGSDKAEREELLAKINRLQSELDTKQGAKEIQMVAEIQIDKFNGKMQARGWLRHYEKECFKLGFSDNDKIKVLRYRLVDSAAESFLRVFVEKGWSSVCYAIHFKWLAGRLVDYGLKKEHLLLGVKTEMTMMSRINLIVAGLPNNIREKLDREHIDSTDTLFNELRKFDPYQQLSLTQKPVLNTPSEKKEFSRAMKAPCHVCQSLGFSNRFHASTVCRNKGKLPEWNQVNMAELTDISTENKWNDENSKN